MTKETILDFKSSSFNKVKNNVTLSVVTLYIRLWAAWIKSSVTDRLYRQK